MTALILIVATVWLVAIACSVSGILLVGSRQASRARVGFILGLVGAGLSLWALFPPHHLFPSVGYTYTSGPRTIYLQSSWFFIGSLVLASLGLIVGAWFRWMKPVGA